ncbi:MAG: glutamate--tRNA ligase [Deltaproteobacteria bacterium]|nr:glutamate--tRNA ligase [Deltaproteobacteria bacterium]
MSKVVTRFPPSPTGSLHVGGARTALFNWLYARRNNGKFILRIEDTDKERSTKESTDTILDSLKWLGLNWDEGPYFQSERADIHWGFVQRLLDSGNAYWCYCTPEELERKREEAMRTGGKPKYDGCCREAGLSKLPGSVVRLKAPLTGVTSFTDTVKGPIAFENSELDDLVIWRSDGTPTYHLAVVADDISMAVNTVIRGDDHVSNTPRQVMIYKALNEPLPLYAHVPMVLGADKKRLSKRHGAASVTEYREMGYLPAAVINYLARLGWSFGDQEFFTLSDLVEKFNLENIGKSAGVFDPGKLMDLNGEHIRATGTADLVAPFAFQMERLGVGIDDRDRAIMVMDTLKIRSKTLVEMAEKALFYYQDRVEYDEKAKKCFTTDLKPAVSDLLGRLEVADFGDHAALEEVFKTVMEAHGLGFGKIAGPVRAAITGRTASPGMFEMLMALGKEKTLERLNAALPLMS